jgi:TonB family protein
MKRKRSKRTAIREDRPTLRRGLAGKGVVLLTVDKATGKVTSARMLQSTGNDLLDGSALQAYSQWRFEPGTVTQIQMPIKFKPGPIEQF